MENKIIITQYQNERLYIAKVNDSAEYLLKEALPLEDARSESADIGAIYVGRVEQIASNLDAAFVRLTSKQTGYLPLREIPKDAGEIKPGSLIAVQIAAPPKGSKLSALTSKLTLSTNNAILIYGDKGIGCSAKLPTAKRSVLTEAVRDTLSKNGCIAITDRSQLIIRTEASDDTKTIAKAGEAVAKDAVLLDEKLSEILSRAHTRSAFSKLKAGDDAFLIRERFLTLYHYIRAVSDEDTVVRTDDRQVKTVLMESGFMEQHKDLSLRFSEPGESDFITQFCVKSLIKDVKAGKIYLPSGGSIVIDKTEAMLVIDVNSGKDIRRKKADTGGSEVLKVNLEAAKESLRQLRLRETSGIIIIDFINMKGRDDLNALSGMLRSLCEKDPVKTRFVGFTQLGLAELTRKRG